MFLASDLITSDACKLNSPFLKAVFRKSCEVLFRNLRSGWRTMKFANLEACW